ncbi:uncharacterized protein LOC143908667 [Temnothorax americanus]|uniref:uncharacterized protein LOC143908667 n=1 Tax=Temnothorax americanus TaxID=1964332 RepID=UPI004068EDFE
MSCAIGPHTIEQLSDIEGQDEDLKGSDNRRHAMEMKAFLPKIKSSTQNPIGVAIGIATGFAVGIAIGIAISIAIALILDEILNGIRNLQDRVNQLETANPERREFHARREPSNLPFEVTYGRTSYDIRNQAERAIGYLHLKEARDMIPEFDGASSKLQEFLSAASYVIKNINPMEERTLLEAVLCTKLKGRAMIDFQAREIRDFAQLKKELEVCYLSRKSTTHLQLEFNTFKQKPGENAKAFGLRADKLVMELYDSMIDERNHTIESKRTILETIQQQALQNFQLGLRDEIKLLVRAQHFATLQEAIAGASAEEKVNGPS